jgi:hypothetical protein
MNLAKPPSPSIARATGIRVRQTATATGPERPHNQTWTPRTGGHRNPNPAPSLAHHATLTGRCLKPTVSRSSPCVSGRMRSDYFKLQSSRKARKHVGLTSDASCNRSYSKRQTLRPLAPRDNAHKGHHITTRTGCSCPRSGTAHRETSRVPAQAQKSQPDRRSPEARFGQRNHGGASLPTLTSFTDTCTTR